MFNFHLKFAIPFSNVNSVMYLLLALYYKLQFIFIQHDALQESSDDRQVEKS